MNENALQEIVRRVVEVAQPERIILFGSTARHTTGTHSDLDLLVITTGPVHRGRLTQEIYMKLIGVGQAVDVVVVTPEDVSRYRDNPYLVIEPAIREGTIIYDREAPPTR
ncbi:MAG: nucleotidyltransferase domain-containing protein [Anaerolineales bacterium]|nr:nucleotidyltransferase domain-containing protein [Anaerolineales bacterium]